MSAGLAALVATLAALAASMAAFALFGARRDADAERKGSQFLMGLGDFLVHWLMWLIGPLERGSLRLGLTPDFYNFAGLALGALSGLLIAAGRLELGGWAIALGGVADIMDGRIARARGLVSSYGTFIDSTLDRFVEVFALLGFTYFLRAHALGPLLAAAAIAGSLLVSYTRARGESVGVLCKEGLMQRAERLVLLFLVCLLDRPLAGRFGWAPGTASVWVLGLIAAGTFATAAHRTVWIAGRLRAR
ncbi:MAG TPA: CDP-alcohol phosphatidyltransferase family protein [Vicinamibacteria bacterium]